MARKYIINGRVYEEDSQRKVITNGRVLEEDTAVVGGVTEIPPRLHKLDNQFATIIAHRMGGAIE